MPIGSGGTNWKPQIAALIGTEVNTLTVETHWHPAGSTRGADTRHVFEQLQGIVAEATASTTSEAR